MTRYRPAVGWIHVVLGALTLLPALLLPLLFGGLWSIVAVSSDDPQATAIVGVTFGAVLVVVVSVLALCGGLSIAAGVGLLQGKAWGEVLTLIASALHLANFPLGSALGAFSLWVLLVREPRSLVAAPRADPGF